VQPSVAKHRAQVARRTQTCPPDHPSLVEARQNLKAARLEEHIRKLVDSAPPLTAEQRDRLAVLLRPSAA